jgi:transposase
VRWVVERAFTWLHQFKRLRTRYERRADLHQGLLDLGCSLICLRLLQRAVNRASSGDGPRPR